MQWREEGGRDRDPGTTETRGVGMGVCACVLLRVCEEEEVVSSGGGGDAFEEGGLHTRGDATSSAYDGDEKGGGGGTPDPRLRECLKSFLVLQENSDGREACQIEEKEMVPS